MPRIVRFHEKGACGPQGRKCRRPAAWDWRGPGSALGLNHAELMLGAGRYVTTPSFPSRPGYETAGAIEAVGPGVTDYAAGERVGVIPFLSAGRWTEIAFDDHRPWRVCKLDWANEERWRG